MADLIERSAVLHDLESLWDYSTVDGITASTVLAQVKTDVRNVPAVDAVPVVHGHWIQVGVYDSNDNCTFECSCCHTGDTHARSVIVPYCWKCGAKMDGKDET